MCVLGIEPRSSERAASGLNCWAVFPAPGKHFWVYSSINRETAALPLPAARLESRRVNPRFHSLVCTAKLMWFFFSSTRVGIQGLQPVRQGLHHWAATPALEKELIQPSCQFHRNMTDLFLKLLISQVIFRLHLCGPQTIFMGGLSHQRGNEVCSLLWLWDLYTLILPFNLLWGRRGPYVTTHVCGGQRTSLQQSVLYLYHVEPRG